MIFGIGHFAMPFITRFVIQWRWPHAIGVTYYGTMRYETTKLENLKSFILNAEVAQGLRLADEIEDWINQNSVSYQFIPAAPSPFDRTVAGTVRFRTSFDLVMFKLAWSDLLITDEGSRH